MPRHLPKVDDGGLGWAHRFFAMNLETDLLRPELDGLSLVVDVNSSCLGVLGDVLCPGRADEEKTCRHECRHGTLKACASVAGMG